MKRLLALILAVAPLAAPAADKPKWKSLDATLEPHKVYEHCDKLAAGEQRRFHWKSTAPVDFNIHYHEGNDATYPVKRDGMRGDGGTFVAKTGQDYCWMWTARNAKARVQGQVEAGDASRSR
jgi:hypothetical protein